MNLIVASPDWLAWLLAALLTAAAAQDAYQLKISNLLTLTVFVLAIVAIVLSEPGIEIWQNVAVFAALLAGGTLLFSLGKVGGGDVKLLAAVGLWTSLHEAMLILAAVFIAGGVLALLILFARTVGRSREHSRWKVLRPGAGIPYGIAIAAGTLIVLSAQRF